MPSTVIDHIAYREDRSELVVTFVGGKVYAYGLVPKRVYEDFRSSRSKGNFFNDQIRDRYPARQIRSAPQSNDAQQDWNSALEHLKKK